MSWHDIENAMQRAVALASGYESDQVTWSYQNVNQPGLDSIVITFGGEIAIGQDWIRNDQDLTRPVGQEIKQQIRGVREVPFQIEVFTTTTSGNISARRIAELIRTKLQLPAIRSGIRRAGVSPFDSGPVNWVPDIPTANFRGRAVVEIRCYVPVMDCYEYAGYIERIQGTIYPIGPINYHGASGIAFDTSGSSGHI